MRKLIAAVLSTVFVLGMASPALAAANPRGADSRGAAAEVPYTEALNRLAKYVAEHRYSDLSNITRQDGRIEATAVRDGTPIRLSVDVTSGAVQEHQG
jgi:hypothetical protein